jgi:hypothetical protein
MVVLGLNAWAVFTDHLVGLLVARPGDALLDGVEGSAGAGCASVADAPEVVLSSLRGGLDGAGGCIQAQADVSVHSVPVLLACDVGALAVAGAETSIIILTCTVPVYVYPILPRSVSIQHSTAVFLQVIQEQS